MMNKRLATASLVLALTLATAPTAVSAIPNNATTPSTDSRNAYQASHAERFANAMSAGKTSLVKDYARGAEPLALPGAAVGVAARTAGKWAAKQVAKGALTEAGKKLIGIW